MTQRSGPRAFFDSQADAYGRHATWRQSAELKFHVEVKIQNINPRICIDLGAGDQSLLSEVARLSNVVCLDISMEMLRRNRDSPSSRVLGTIEQLPIVTGTMDLVYASQSLHYTLLHRSGKEITRVLRPQGRLIVVQLTDSDSIESNWYAEWKSFKEGSKRGYLSAGVIEQWGLDHGLELLNAQGINVEQFFDWSALFEKYDANKDPVKQAKIRRFFEFAPERTKNGMHLRVDGDGVSMRRVISLMEFKLA